MTVIVVENSGALTTLQDLGRYGFEHFGVSPAGPMDARSFTLANLLVGNDRNAAAMEISILGPTLRFTAPAVIALTGCDTMPQCNDRPLPLYTAVAVAAGDVLRMGAAKTGCRAYLAVAGGFDVPEIMGSRATSVQNKIGGQAGRKLQRGDELAVGKAAALSPATVGRTLPAESFGGGQPVTVRVLLGPQEEEFTPEGIQTFLSSSYTVENDSNRMGYRLQGPVIAHSGDGNIISDGIATGSVQVPAAGLPILMLAERQTVGGYPKIATVITVDLPKVGQCRPGDSLRFQTVDIEEAQRLYGAYLEELEQIERKLNGKRPVPAVYFGETH